MGMQWECPGMGESDSGWTGTGGDRHLCCSMQEGSLLEYAEKTRCPDSRNRMQRAAFGRWTLGAFFGGVGAFWRWG